MADINVAPAPRQTLQVNLVGKMIHVKTPKASIAIEMARDSSKFNNRGKKKMTDAETLALIDTLYDWLKMIVSPKDFEVIKKRLRDPEDGLDIPHITEMISKVSEFAGQNPSTSPSD